MNKTITELDLCWTCLSAGRKMYSLGIYLDIFESIISKVLKCDTKLSTYRLCWECFSLLRNVHRFQLRASKAQNLLEYKNVNHKALSTLCTTTFDTKSTDIEFNYRELYPEIVTKTEVIISKLENISGSDREDFIENTVDLSHDKIIKQSGKRKKYTNNKWVSKKISQRKKPKYKLINNINKINMNFKIILLNEIDVRKQILKKKDNNYCNSEMQDTCNNVIKEDLLSISKPTTFICDICNLELKSKEVLQKHIAAHYFKYECKWCEHICYKKEKAKKHLDKHKQLLQCLRCGYKCGSSEQFESHYKDWHEKYICDHCGVSFKMRYCIRNHIRRKHGVYKCELCGQEFKRYNGLWVHKKIRHSEVQARAYCDVCDKHFVDAFRYKWHLSNSVQHKKPRKKVQIPCPECDKIFSKNIYMKDHYNLVHLNIVNYKCDICEKTFIRNADLVRHKRRIHEGILPPKNKICHCCGRGFATNKILENHLRTHTTATHAAT